MIILFLILIITACILISFLILVQNPKGGGLSGTIAGINNQFMGVKQTNDVLTKGTWIFATIIALLSITSILFLKSSVTSIQDKKIIESIPTQNAAPAATPATTPAPVGK